MRQSTIRGGAFLSRRESGFTLLEMMIVVAIILILVALGAQQYQRSLISAREAALRSDLRDLRQAIERFTLDKQTAPQSLEDLASAGYLHGIPDDPITRRKDWRVDYGSEVISPEQTGTGITDVHSASDGVSPFTNTPYSSW